MDNPAKTEKGARSRRRGERLGAIVAAGRWLGRLVPRGARAPSSPRLWAATLIGSDALGWGTALGLSRPPRIRIVVRFTRMTLALTLLLGSRERLSGSVAPTSAPGLPPRDPNPGTMA